MSANIRNIKKSLYTQYVKYTREEMSTTMEYTCLEMNSSKFLQTTTGKPHLTANKVASYKSKQMAGIRTKFHKLISPILF
jgi:hypothetical protein